MRILRNILLTVVALLVVLVGVGLLLGDRVHVERSVVIDAPPAAVFALVNDFREFNRWSPWADIDPNTRYTFEGPSSGVGAKMSWQSDNPNVGAGSQEIVESHPPDLVRTRLDFGPQGQATAFYRLDTVEGNTRVTWGFDTEFGNNLLGRYFGLMMDRWVGADYEKGLARLKTIAETGQTPG